jgi:predicted DCC family thiol-disulfide oxidoreductase YuxK
VIAPKPCPPQKVLLLYDGECPFCRAKAASWEGTSRGNVQILPIQSGAGEGYGFPATRSPQSVVLIEMSGEIFTGAGAVFRLASIRGNGAGALLWWLYRRVGAFRLLAEWGYRLVARHRGSLTA